MLVATAATLRWLVWLRVRSRVNASSAVIPLRLIRMPMAWSMTARLVKRGLQVRGQALRLGEDLRVLHGDRRGHGEQLPDVFGMIVERVLWGGRTRSSHRRPRPGSAAVATARCAPPTGRPAGPNRGHRGSPLRDPDRMVCPVAAALMHGPSPMPYWMSSISWTNGALFTTVSARSASSSVNPAPSAPGIACTAKVATRVSRSSSDNRAVDNPANAPARSSSDVSLDPVPFDRLDRRRGTAVYRGRGMLTVHDRSFGGDA